MKAPFPGFGGKSRAADLIWARLGNCPNYVEPFAGTLAVLLARPHAPGTETVNDADCFISNFWRALQAEPDTVASYADWPVIECDLHARHRWLMGLNSDEDARARAEWREKMRTDPNHYDAQIAGWWVWGKCAWIGSGWCDSKHFRADGLAPEKAPRLATGGAGVHRKRPHLANDGKGVNRLSLKQQIPVLSGDGRGINRDLWQQIPHLRDSGQGVNRPALTQQIPALDPGGRGAFRATEKGGLYGYLGAVRERLRRTRVCCGDWSRVMGPSVTFGHGLTAVLLDPPYSTDEREGALYGVDSGTVAADVLEWCKANGDNRLLRVALCGYDGEHNVLESMGWTVEAWKAAGGYGSQAQGRGRDNARRERIWFSPHCLKPGLFGTHEGGEA